MSELKHIPADDEMMTRRELFGSIPKVAAVAAAVAAGGVAVALDGCGAQDVISGVDVLKVANNEVITLDSFTEIEDPSVYYDITELARLPHGCMLFSSDGVTAVILQPGETAVPLSVVRLMDLATGDITDVLPEPVGLAEGFDIYEVRASSDLLLWVESNYLNGEWRVYSASVSYDIEIETKEEEEYYNEINEETGELDYKMRTITTEIQHKVYSIGDPVMMDSGDSDYDAPELAVVGNLAYWLVMPNEHGDKSTEDSILKTSSGAAVPGEAYVSHGRFCGGLSVSDQMLTALPRNDSGNTVYYQLTAFTNGSVSSTQMLPHSYRPNTAIFLNGFFSFGINGSYDYGDGISNVGTYYRISEDNWLRLIKEPVTPPGMCNTWLYCKSGSRTVFVDLEGQRYFTINAPNGTEDHGDYPIQVGQTDAVFNYATVSHVSNGVNNRTVVVRRIDLKSEAQYQEELRIAAEEEARRKAEEEAARAAAEARAAEEAAAAEEGDE